MTCNAIDKAFIGRRELWMHCGLLPRHEGLHHDPKRPGHYWEETFYAFEFEYGRSTRIGSVKMARKEARCKKCEKPYKTQGSAEICVCKAIGSKRRQSILFAEEREKVYRENPRDPESITEDDIAFTMASQIARWQEARDNDPDNYCGEF